eukprot:GHVT01013472.1.p2 GENE.GHVT01013472.1~~GHVT01013472.1.p2  ORF type:complete len:154 (+),score=12.40 GHVT01013472.1:130-591(+)
MKVVRLAPLSLHTKHCQPRFQLLHLPRCHPVGSWHRRYPTFQKKSPFHGVSLKCRVAPPFPPLSVAASRFFSTAGVVSFHERYAETPPPESPTVSGGHEPSHSPLTPPISSRGGHSASLDTSRLSSARPHAHPFRKPPSLLHSLVFLLSFAAL